MIGYYVTVVRGQRVGWLAGPFASHSDAIEMVEPTRKLAETIDPFVCFDAFGTARREGATLPKGVLL